VSFANLVEWLAVSSEPFHKNVIQCPATPIHADGNTMRLEHPGKRFAGELVELLAI